MIIEAETTEGQLDASVSVNGRLLATATGNPSAPVIRGEGGRELVPDELRALGAVVEMSGEIFLPAGCSAPGCGGSFGDRTAR